MFVLFGCLRAGTGAGARAGWLCRRLRCTAFVAALLLT